ncbi:hypothetical protein HMI55_003785 [Coelomomyces lativittatus]|nr:hypothetical protein HMI55_003785 [Coelomomyces lativittatus]
MMGTLRNGNNEDVFLTSWKAYEGKDFLNLNLNLNPTTTTTNTSHLQHDPHCNIPSSLVRNLVLDYLAMECYEKTLLKLVHAHPFVQHCLEEKVVALPFFSSSSSMTSSSTMNRITTPTKKGPVSCSSSLKWINTGRFYFTYLSLSLFITLKKS